MAEMSLPGDEHVTASPAPRIGLFGLLGLRNSGNEASLEAVLAYLRRAHPDAVIDAMTGGFERVRDIHGIPTTALSWHEAHGAGKRGPAGVLLRAGGKLIDPLRIVAWVRRHDAVIVPGAGVLEATLPVRAYGFPLAMFLLTASGKLCRVKVALVSVGANIIQRRGTRWLLNGSARRAFYRSYRDQQSMDAMRSRGVDTSMDRVFPDLVFAVPTPPYEPGDPRLVGVGVMDYHGSNDDRARAGEIHSAYVEKITAFSLWLLENGYDVRFFGGDDNWDYSVAEQIMASVAERVPDRGASARMAVVPFSSYESMLGEMNRVGTVVATRYHNVLAALKLCKPTISLGYSQKFIALMDSMDLSEFTQPADKFTVDELIRQFEDAQRRRADLAPRMMKRNEANSRELAEQFGYLSAALLPETSVRAASRPDRRRPWGSRFPAILG
jgi:polysaccharide pyruvyl transferase WcaK-like protein